MESVSRSRVESSNRVGCRCCRSSTSIEASVNIRTWGALEVWKASLRLCGPVQYRSFPVSRSAASAVRNALEARRIVKATDLHLEAIDWPFATSPTALQFPANHYCLNTARYEALRHAT